MALRNEKALRESRGLQQPPIEFVTENGFSIVRLCELDTSSQGTGDQCRFVVADPNGCKGEVIVEFTANAVALLQRQRQNPLSLEAAFWLECAERQLAAYLWQSDSFPPGNRLIVNDLSCDDVRLGSSWID